VSEILSLRNRRAPGGCYLAGFGLPREKKEDKRADNLCYLLFELHIADTLYSDNKLVKFDRGRFVRYVNGGVFILHVFAYFG
jgi:hypothetical protein